VEDDQVADRLALGDVGAPGQDHERLGGLSGLGPRRRRQPEHEDKEDSDNHRPTHADHLHCFQSRLFGQGGQLDTNRHDRPYRASAHVLVPGSQAALLGEDQMADTRWRKTLRGIAVEEMLHLALVST
jgi:hypothetical protein